MTFLFISRSLERSLSHLAGVYRVGWETPGEFGFNVQQKWAYGRILWVNGYSEE